MPTSTSTSRGPSSRRAPRTTECRGSEMGAEIVGWALWRPRRACGVCHEERATWAPRWPHEASGRYTGPWADQGAGYGRRSGPLKPGEARARFRSLIGVDR